MANINKIRLSGTTYSIQDENATKTVELTQAEYDALSPKDPNTFYIITDAKGGDLSNYYTKTETDGLLDTKLDVTAYTPTDLSNYYTKSETSGATEISTALASKADTATTYTKTEVDNAITAATSTKQDTLVSGTNIKTINNQSILGEGNITIEGGGSSYTAGDGIDITNDVISVTGKVDTSTYETYTAATDTALASKQTTLTAGTGISIVDNVISATGGGSGGGMTEDDELLLSTALTDLNDRKIDASEVKSNYQKKGDYATKNYVTTALEPYETKLDEINTEEVTAYALNDLNNKFGGLSLVKITESEYAALTTKDENTLYVVVADQS